jgi:hypothetical protein
VTTLQWVVIGVVDYFLFAFVLGSIIGKALHDADVRERELRRDWP